MSDRPNILLITADQMRWDCLASMGNPVIQTPNLDRLAARGVLFRNGFSPDPICVPARASIMTGNYPHICTGHKSNGGRILDGQPLLTEVLKSVGYRTYALGKLHFVPYSAPGQPRLVHGFEHVDLWESGRIMAQFDPEGKLSGVEDYYDYLRSVGWAGYTRAHGVGNNDVRPCPSPLPAQHYVDTWIANCTITQIDRHQKEFADRPFFMWMSSPKPHSPYDPPRPYDHMYDPRQLPKPFGSEADLRQRNPLVERTRYDHAISTLSPEAIQVMRSYYYGNISFLDSQIGRVMDHLESVGQLDNTVVLFTADHGDLLGDFGSFFKVNHLNGSVRVPFLAAGPGITEGAVSEALVGLQDVMPTFVEAAGAKIGQSVQGQSLMAHMADPNVSVRETYYASTMQSPWQSAMLTDGKWKYIYSEACGVEELYDQVEDPCEEVNLVGNPEHAERLSEMRARLRQRAEELGDTNILDGDGFAKTDMDREALAKLPVGGMGWRWY